MGARGRRRGGRPEPHTCSWRPWSTPCPSRPPSSSWASCSSGRGGTSSGAWSGSWGASPCTLFVFVLILVLGPPLQRHHRHHRLPRPGGGHRAPQARAQGRGPHRHPGLLRPRPGSGPHAHRRAPLHHRGVQAGGRALPRRFLVPPQAPGLVGRSGGPGLRRPEPPLPRPRPRAGEATLDEAPGGGAAGRELPGRLRAGRQGLPLRHGPRLPRRGLQAPGGRVRPKHARPGPLLDQHP